MNKKFFFLLLLVPLLALFIFNNSFHSFEPKIRVSMCDDFSYPETKIICYAFFFSNPEYCKLVDNFKTECYYFSTIKNVSKDFCNGIEDPYVNALCFSNFAIKNKDPSLCEKNIKDATLLESCFTRIPSIYYNLYSENYCNNITHESAIYTCLAIIKGDLSYCEKIIIEPFEKDLCQAMVSKNYKYCNLDVCYENMALLEKNLSLCNFVQARWGKAECVGLVSRNTQKCEELEGTISQDLCKLHALTSKELKL